MIISYNWLNSFFKEKIKSPQEIAEAFTVHAFEVAPPFPDKQDYILDMDVLPDRDGDCLSHFGIAREYAAIFDAKIEEIKMSFKEDQKTNIDKYLSVSIKSKKCRRYTAAVLTGIKIDDSPKWIQDRLMACGISPINNIVDVTNYVMLELGQPLHALDYEKMSDNKSIIVEETKKKTKMTLLSGAQISLPAKTLTINDEKDFLAIAGIKGGKKAEIGQKTKAIVLEAANFDFSAIRKTSRSIGLRTDSSWRFEHNLDPELTIIGIKRAIHLIQKISGATVLKGLVDIYPDPEKKNKIELNLQKAERLLGKKVPLIEIKRIFKKLNFKIIKEGKDFLRIESPSYRRDIEIEENLIEEIGRLYGYGKIKPCLPEIDSRIEKNESIFLKNRLRNAFKEFSFSEVYNYSFISEKEKENFNLSRLIQIENPVNVYSKYLRNSLIPQLVNNLELNLKYQNSVNIYEIGKIFKANGGFSERTLVSGLISNKDFALLKGYLESIFNELGIFDIRYSSNNDSSFLNKRKSAIIRLNGKDAGEIGHLPKSILAKYKIKGDPVLFEIDFSVIKKEFIEIESFKPISIHPIVTRDISIIVPEDVLIDEVMETIGTVGGDLKDIDLKDLYEDDKGKKSLTFRMILQAEDRSLSNKEINNWQKKLINILEKNPDWEVKK